MKKRRSESDWCECYCEVKPFDDQEVGVVISSLSPNTFSQSHSVGDKTTSTSQYSPIHATAMVITKPVWDALASIDPSQAARLTTCRCPIDMPVDVRSVGLRPCIFQYVEGRRSHKERDDCYSGHLHCVSRK